ncbi:coiled-coil domain-containing protein 77 isoform X3 [Lingula anatina]|uniref:Coiled-coil domain-containing protein 77 isoform X3 n=1 Tax=Lingula anatina TaxID=7574 RepID=A0A1S3HDH8_LINAN|nr:coiled-coil domain-containing protein 77 isoform X3 [Lingula anatina]|eukprot:XP_013384088.1 coiled-coil domain-containing protein 77 isoform X3 [Lingula anatina]
MATSGRRQPVTPLSRRSRQSPDSSLQTSLASRTSNPDNMEVKNEEEDTPIPDVNERLSYVRPSRELLEYYRKKIAEYDDEHEMMNRKLDQYRMTYMEQHKLQWELRQREEEIAELQKALSDMQVYLFQEREHVLRLYAENDRLKIRELDDRKKIHQLLAVSGVSEGEVSYFFKEPPAKPIIPQRQPHRVSSQAKGVPSQARGESTSRQHKGKRKVLGVVDQNASPSDQDRYNSDNQTLTLQVEALQAQLEEQTRLAKDHVDGLLEDRRVKIEEYEARRQRDHDKIQTLLEKLTKTQDLLYDSTKDFLELRYEGRANERRWMAEKDQFLRELDVCKQQLNISRDKVLNVSDEALDAKQKREVEVEALQYDLEQAVKMSDMYREQVIQLEDERARIREEGDVSKDIFKERTDKMSRRLQLMNARYQELEKRRNLEVEGFKNDIKMLRAKLKEMEKQLYKVTVGLGEGLEEQRPDDLDLVILRNIL